MRQSIVFTLTLLVAGALVPGTQADNAQAQVAPSATSTCAARPSSVGNVAFHWFTTPQEDAPELESWCRGVGTPVVTAAPASAVTSVPRLDELVIVSWNAHLAEGRLTDLIDDLRRGALTDGQPVSHFVLLLQELYRRGSDVPDFQPDARAAYAITARDPEAPDAHAYAARLGLAVAYVPSMRNGAQVKEDRGNAIVSSEPLNDIFAVELPFERQRRVVAGAAVVVATDAGHQRLQVVDTHLEPLASPANLWILRNPRRRQISAVLDLLQQPRFQTDSVGTVIGGDFNTIQGGAREEAYRRIRSWSTSLRHEDPRATHMLGRLDYVFARLAPEWQVTTTRVAGRYGSDHHPVLARFHRSAATRTTSTKDSTKDAKD